MTVRLRSARARCMPLGKRAAVLYNMLCYSDPQHGTASDFWLCVLLGKVLYFSCTDSILQSFRKVCASLSVLEWCYVM